MNELIANDHNRSICSQSDLAQRLRDLRRIVRPLTTKPGILAFGAWTRSLPATRTVSDTPTWTVDQSDRRAAYAVRKAAKAGTLRIMASFVTYDSGDGFTATRAPLTFCHASYDEVARTATMLGPMVMNVPLVDRLFSIGIEVTGSPEAPLLSAMPGTRATAHLAGDDRVAEAVEDVFDLSSYLDPDTSPKILDHPLVRFFVGECASETTMPAATNEHPQSSDSANREIGEKIADKEPTDVGSSERLSEVDSWPPLPEPALDPDQRRAVEHAFANQAIAIDGPPGTGKSQVIAAIATVATSRGLSVIVTSTEPSALEVARRRIPSTAGAIVVSPPPAIASRQPPAIGQADFDILVIDEASRMPLAVAVALMTRARSVVIIGDEKQMRPATEGETILEAATRTGIPRISLRFHYRSRERSLITPSNIISYRMSLRMVPTPDLKPANGIKARFVKPILKETSQGLVNEAEAYAVLDEIENWLAQPKPGSFGVVTANLAQRSLIAKLAQARFKPAWMEERSNSDELPFIRYHQQVQGEERDRIVLSTVYDAAPGRRFGVFDGPDGLRTLNVMLSRARDIMTVVTSFERVILPISSPGRLAFETLEQILRSVTRTETRQMTPRCFQELARRVGMKADHLGVVIGLRFPDEARYRIGLAVPSDGHSLEQGPMIERQLQAVGWTTLRTSEAECMRSMTATVDAVRTMMARSQAR